MMSQRRAGARVTVTTVRGDCISGMVKFRDADSTQGSMANGIGKTLEIGGWLRVMTDDGITVVHARQVSQVTIHNENPGPV